MLNIPVNNIYRNGVNLNYQQLKQHDYSQDYLTFRINSSGDVSRESIDMTAPDIFYSLNGGNWATFSSVSVVDGDVLRFKGTNLNYATMFSYTHFISTANFDVEGNIMSLVYGDNFVGNTELVSAFTFTNLFESAITIQSAENLVLPATSLTESCYESMFRGCTSLTTAPELPATTLADGCYGGMFRSCTSLTTAPELPATTLANNCYQTMFIGCISLTTAPELPATTLADLCYQEMFLGCTTLTSAPELPATSLTESCYYYMFYGCTNLNYIKCLATDISAYYCTSNWVNGVSATGTFVKADGVSWPTGVDGIPSGWTVQEV